MKVILAIDGTRHSQAAVQMIFNLNFDESSELRIISIVDMAVPIAMDHYDGFVPSTIELETSAKEKAESILVSTKTLIAEKYPEVLITTEVLLGSPDSRIVEKAEEINADLIVVGSHGYNRWERLLLGSVSDSVVHHSPCSVLIVRN